MERYPSKLYMWQDEFDPQLFHFQTDCPQMRKKLMNRKGFEDSGLRGDPPLWVMSKFYKQPRNAFRAFRRLTGQDCYLNPVSAVYSTIFVPTVSIEKKG